MRNKIFHIEKLIEPPLEGMEMVAVRVQIIDNHTPTLQIMIDRKDGEPISIENCANASRSISAVLDADDILKEAYTLEVSSPGIDRPLVHPHDFERFVGFDVKIEMRTPINRKKRFRGRLLGIVDNAVHIAAKSGEDTLPIDQIEKAKLLLTDELLAATEAGTIEQ